MKNKKKQNWTQQTLRMKDNHTWKAPGGYKIVVMDRGAVSFNVPQNWLVAKLEPFELNDAPPPDDNARLSVTFWRNPPGIDWTGLPLKQLLLQSTTGVGHDTLSRSEVLKLPRADLEIVWNEHRFMDPVEHREAYSRHALARGWDVHALLTLDLWVTDAEKLQPMWDEVMRSLQLGRTIEDPTKGPTLH
jgi:hypothetical protein